MPKRKSGGFTAFAFMPELDLPPRHFAFLYEYVKDFNAGRAAEASGYHPETGNQILKDEKVQRALDYVITERCKKMVSDIDADWALLQLVDNHLLARQAGKISQSNQALSLIMKHAQVDAFAADKMITNTDEKIMERLQRARKRQTDPLDNEEPSFL